MCRKGRGFRRKRKAVFSPAPLLVTCGLIFYSAAAQATPSLCDLPVHLNDRYDVNWTLTISNPRQAAFSLDVEIPLTGYGGYRLTLSARLAKWESRTRPPAFAAITAPLNLTKNDAALWTLKRRPQIIALLYNHRLVSRMQGHDKVF